MELLIHKVDCRLRIRIRIIIVFIVLSHAYDHDQAAFGAHIGSRFLLRPSSFRNESSFNNGGFLRPLQVFEVAKPVEIGEKCGQVVLRHVFGNTIEEPPVVRRYSPQCGDLRWSRVVLKWTASSTGRQFDRIAAVWLGGVEILRTCTAEPVKQPGIQWTVEKDVTRFSSLWKRPQVLAVELANVVDGVYTGVYDVTLSVHFYGYGGDVGADVVLPFERHWFWIRDESDVVRRKMKIPRNAYKAVVEICVSFHENDEFWYSSPPSEYQKVNNFSEKASGAFREILVTIDDLLAGVVYPFPVIYTGGINPNFWRPVSGIGSFVLPSYDIDITPLLGRLLESEEEEEEQEFSVSVINALPSWLLGLNLHVWVDGETVVRGSTMVSHFSSSYTSKTKKSEMLTSSLDGTFLITASRGVSYSGWLESSFGNLTTSVEYAFRFSHTLVLSDGANAVSVHQESVTEKKVVVRSDERCVLYEHGLWRFPLRLSMHGKSYREEEEGGYVIKASVDHAWEEDQSRFSPGGYGGATFFSSLKNRQMSQGKMFVARDGEIEAGVATTRQSLVYDGSGGCYFRSLGVASKGSFLFDHSHTRCT